MSSKSPAPVVTAVQSAPSPSVNSSDQVNTRGPTGSEVVVEDGAAVADVVDVDVMDVVAGTVDVEAGTVDVEAGTVDAGTVDVVDVAEGAVVVEAVVVEAVVVEAVVVAVGVGVVVVAAVGLDVLVPVAVAVVVVTPGVAAVRLGGAGLVVGARVGRADTVVAVVAVVVMVGDPSNFGTDVDVVAETVTDDGAKTFAPLAPTRNAVVDAVVLVDVVLVGVVSGTEAGVKVS